MKRLLSTLIAIAFAAAVGSAFADGDTQTPAKTEGVEKADLYSPQDLSSDDAKKPSDESKDGGEKKAD